MHIRSVLCFALVVQLGCDLGPNEDADAVVGAETQELWSGTEPYIDFDRCTAAQEATIRTALTELRTKIHPSWQGSQYQDCLADVWVGEAWDHNDTPEDWFEYSNAPGELEISCVNLGFYGGETNLCDETQQMELDSQLVDRAATDSSVRTLLRQTILHELHHLAAGGCYAHTSNTSTSDYAHTVPNQTEECVKDGDAPRRRSNLTGKVRQAWAGVRPPLSPDTPNRVREVMCPDNEVVVGFTGRHVTGWWPSVNEIGVICARPGSSSWWGAHDTGWRIGSASGNWYSGQCTSSRVATGLTMSYADTWSGAQFGGLQVTCDSLARVRGASSTLPAALIFPAGSMWTSTRPRYARRNCGEGKALVGVRGYETGTGHTLRALQPVCRSVDEVGFAERPITPWGAAAGGTGGSPAQLRCPGNSIGVGLSGGVGAVIDSVMVVCQDEDLNDPGQLRTWAHAASEEAGTANRTGSFELKCSPVPYRDNVMVGVQGVAGWHNGRYVIRKLPAKCADLASWRGGNTSSYTTATAGTGSGQWFDRSCPAGQVLVGLDVRHGANIDQVRVVCSSLWRPTLINW